MSVLASAPRNLLLLLLSTALWAALFRAASVLSQRHVRVYRDFSRAEQGDWSSRCVRLSPHGIAFFSM